jgi:hypothetical protein
MKKEIIECATKLYTDWEYSELIGVYPKQVLDFASEMVDLMDNEYPHFTFEQTYDFIKGVEASLI